MTIHNGDGNFVQSGVKFYDFRVKLVHNKLLITFKKSNLLGIVSMDGQSYRSIFKYRLLNAEHFAENPEFNRETKKHNRTD